MSIPGLGDAITLFDLSVRVTTFINDLRHAQDDFIGLRSEADCLRICLGSLTSESCQNALYHYITVKQGQDLKQIVDNCKFNMMDLNSFIAKCAKLGDNSSMTIRTKRDFFKKISQAIGKGFTKYKFVMTDKQAFRDKLVLPTASINVFLTSLTHVGLVNMGRIMIRTGYGSVIPTGAATAGAKDGQKTNVTGIVGAIDGWQAIGKRIAFRDTIVKESDITEPFEGEMLEYALHLIRGGLPFHVKNGSTGTKHKVTKTTRTKTSSRSRSRGPLGLGKGGRGQMYVMRKKSVSRPSTEKVEVVERQWESGSDSDRPHQRLLALPAPDSPTSSRQYIEIEPPSTAYSESGSDHHVPISEPERETRKTREDPRRPSDRDQPRTEARRPPTTSREEIRSRRRDVRDTIRAEQEAAYQELEREEEEYRLRRHQTRLSRPLFHSRDEEIQYEREQLEEDTITFLAENYGIFVEPLPVPREPVDNGIVKDIPPPTASGVVESISDSDASDSPPPTLPPRIRTRGGRSTNDRLRAQTYIGPVRNTASMPRGARFEPYADSYGYFPRRRQRRPSPDFYDERPYPPREYRGSPPSPVNVDEFNRPHPPSEHQPPPPRRPHRRNSDDDSEFGGHASKRAPRGPPPGPPPGLEKNMLIVKSHDDEPSVLREATILRREREEGARRRRTRRQGEHQPFHLSSERGVFDYRDKEDDIRRTRRVLAPSEHGNLDVYMRGARSERGSDESDGGNRIEIVRK